MQGTQGETALQLLDIISQTSCDFAELYVSVVRTIEDCIRESCRILQPLLWKSSGDVTTKLAFLSHGRMSGRKLALHG